MLAFFIGWTTTGTERPPILACRSWPVEGPPHHINTVHGTRTVHSYDSSRVLRSGYAYAAWSPLCIRLPSPVGTHPYYYLTVVPLDSCPLSRPSFSLLNMWCTWQGRWCRIFRAPRAVFTIVWEQDTVLSASVPCGISYYRPTAWCGRVEREGARIRRLLSYCTGCIL